MEKLYRCEEVSKYLGVTVPAVWRWIRNGKLKAVRLGRCYRVRQSDLDMFQIPTASEN